MSKLYTCSANFQNHVLHITKRTCLKKVANLHQQLCAPPIPNGTYYGLPAKQRV